MDKSITVFVSYAHKDEALRQELDKHLSQLKWDNLIDVWNDRDISAGTEWENEIDIHLNTADIILLLVSPDFMASKYCYSVEMQRALERHEQGEAQVIPIILRHVYWQKAPFGKLQALPRDAKPVKSRSWHNMDEAFLSVAEGIRKVIEELATKSAPTILQVKSETDMYQVTHDQKTGNGGQNINYLDFEVEIDEGRRQSHPVVVRSPAGEVRVTMRFPFNELALENRLLALQNALLRSGEKRRQILLPEEQTVRDFGRDLFRALFAGEVYTLFVRSQSEAAHQGKGLRVKLRILSPGLATIPWEFLYDSDQAEYLCLSQSTPVVRYIERAQPPRPLIIDPPLRILGMIANPRNLEELDVERERRRVEKALERLQKNGFVQLTWLDGQRWQDVQRSMRHGPWHVFHFIGHGGFDARMDEGILAFENDEGLAQSISATQLGRLLSDHPPLRLVVLNSCDGARGSQRDIFSSAAATLIRRNIPAVLAMQYEITDRAALIFSHTFYEALADSIPVDAAVSEARKAISIGLENSLEWGTPVLYTRSPDGNLFSINTDKILTASLEGSKSLLSSATSRASVSTVVPASRVSTSFDDGPLRSVDSGLTTTVTFYSSSEDTANIYWLDQQGTEVLKYELEPEQYYKQQTYVNHLWRIKSRSGELLQEIVATEDQQPIVVPSSLRSLISYTSIFIIFNNFSSSVVDTYWVNFQGDEVHYNRLGPGQSYTQQTYVSHPWRIKDQKGQVLGEAVALKDQQLITISASAREARR